MKKPIVVRRSEIPSNSPLTLTIVMWLLLDRIHAPGWAWGVTWSVLVLFWAGFIVTLIKEVELSAFSETSVKRARELREKELVEEMTKP